MLTTFIPDDHHTRRTTTSTQELCQHVQVRPLLEAEKQKGGSPCVEVPENCVVQLPAKRGSAEGYRYDFDRVYKMSSPGRQMFAEVVQPLLDRFMQGFNTTVRLMSCHLHFATVSTPPCALYADIAASVRQQS